MLTNRKNEQRILNKLLTNNQSAVLFLTGRRRVGKTFLVKEVCQKRIVFELSGLHHANLVEQLTHFNLVLKRSFPEYRSPQVPISWKDAFQDFSQILESVDLTQKKVVFLDELDWLNGKRAGFIEALFYWWLSWGKHNGILLVLCSAQVEWMRRLEESIHPLGALTVEYLHLKPFSLLETREFLETRGIRLTDYQLILLYMVLGGIPQYLEQIEVDRSAAENIQAICLDKKSVLRREMTNLNALFFDKKGHAHAVFNVLAKHSKGATRQELLDQLNWKDGGWFTELLIELEASGYLRAIAPLENLKKETVFRIMDPFVFFHYNFIRSATPTESLNWNPMKYGELYRSWSSYAFEGVCLAHLPQIRQYMGLAGMEMHLASRVLKTCDDRENFLLDRRDGIVESVKTFFFADMYTMSESEVNRLQDLKRVLSSELNKKRELRFVAISTYGIADQIPALFENQLDIECLFENLK